MFADERQIQTKTHTSLLYVYKQDKMTKHQTRT